MLFFFKLCTRLTLLHVDFLTLHKVFSRRDIDKSIKSNTNPQIFAEFLSEPLIAEITLNHSAYIRIHLNTENIDPFISMQPQ